MTSVRYLDQNMLERKRRVLPVVIRIRENIDTLFLRYVGPVGDSICSDTYAEWVKSGSIGPSGLLRYIQMISVEIPNPKQSDEFKQQAAKLIRLI